jgi:hypothetical protein
VAPTRLEATVVLLVEGKTAEIFFEALRDHLGLTREIQVQNFGGVNQLRPFLGALTAMNGFRDVVRAVVCVRDAEADALAAFRSVRDSLRAVGLDGPAAAGRLTEGRPRTGVFVLPDGVAPGMLETLCLTSVTADPAMACVDAFMACLETANVRVRNTAKARAQTFLASRGGDQVGRAAQQGHWPLDSPPFEPLRRFLNEAIR